MEARVIFSWRSEEIVFVEQFLSIIQYFFFFLEIKIIHNFCKRAIPIKYLSTLMETKA